MAAQLTATKGERPLSSWTTRARSSLPVPLSPWMRMVAVLFATRRAMRSAASTPALPPITPAEGGRAGAARRA